MINPAIITSKMSWDSLTPDECAAAYLAASWGSPYRIPRDNISFNPSQKAKSG